MTRWRRLCVDIDDEFRVLGSSIEWFSDTRVGPEQITVMEQNGTDGLWPTEALEVLMLVEWDQPSLPFDPWVTMP